MLKAFDAFKEENQSELKFLVVGNRKWWTDSMQSTFDSLQHKNDVVFTGRVSDEDLKMLMGSALANVYVSTFEGFGIPIVEAFQSGVPVITSNVTSMPEIAADAALVVNPFKVDSITQAMTQLVSQEDLRSDLIDKGLARAKTFTWQRSADLLWESILKA